VQIGGPAGAFIVVVYGIIDRYGLANLLIATSLAGVLLFLMGLLRLGTLVRYVPVTIVVGFTNGIAVLIALSQMKDWLGLQVPHAGRFLLAAADPVAAPRQLQPGGLRAGPGLRARAVRLALAGGGSTASSRRSTSPACGARCVTSRLPGPVVALVTLTLLAWGLDLPVETIGSRFGGIPRACLGWPCPNSAGKAPSTCSTPPSPSPCWEPSNRCCARAWPTRSAPPRAMTRTRS
jgi:SulP family sulfate permease